jgi:hypothetical protein
MSEEKTALNSVKIAAGITVASLFLLLLKGYLQLRLQQSILNDSVSIGLLVVAALPWLSQLISSAKIGGNELVFREIAQQKVETDKKLDQMLQLIKNLISEDDREILRKLNSTEPFTYKHVSSDKEHAMRNKFRRLRTFGLIISKRSISDVIDNLNDGEDIKSDISLTQEGKNFIGVE